MPVEQEPWEPARVPLQTAVMRAHKWGKTPLEFFPDQTYADFDPATLAAFEGIEGLAGGMSPSQEAANYLGDVLSGQYMVGGPNANPYAQDMEAALIDPMMERFNETFIPGMQNQWFGAHGAASPGMVQAIGRESRQALDEINRQHGNLLGGMWENERARMQGAAGMAPGIESAMYTPFEMLRGVGADREAQAQQGINEAMARHQFAQTEPIQRTGMMLPFLMGPGQAFTETQYKDMGSGGGGMLGTGIGGGMGLMGSALQGGMFNNIFGGGGGGQQTGAGTGGQSIFGANQSGSIWDFGSPGGYWT